MDLRKSPGTWFLFRPIYMTHNGAFLGTFNYEMNGKEFECSSKLLVDVLWEEYHFRYQVQLKERWGNDPEVINKYNLLENILYLKESCLPEETLKKLYGNLRKHPCWYLRPGLIEDCAARGGCCARECGCCEKRLHSLPRKGISGHCSLACSCCDKTIGRDTLSKINIDFRSTLTSENPFYLERLASLYFGGMGKCLYCGIQTSQEQENERMAKEEDIFAESPDLVTNSKKSTTPRPDRRRTEQSFDGAENTLFPMVGQ
jgi:hypothetical protein